LDVAVLAEVSLSVVSIFIEMIVARWECENSDDKNFRG
jgi:hypothetical protein